MTQDAPLDQKALEAAIAWAQEGTRDDTFSALTFDEHGALIERAIGIFLNALSRRVPASGELVDAADAALKRMAARTGETAEEWAEALAPQLVEAGIEYDRQFASPIVAEGWRTVPVEADGTMIRAGVDERDRPGSGAAVSKIYAAMLSAAPSIPEGVAAPEGWPIKLDMVTSSQFVARVQSDALTTIALPMIEELSKRPQTVWGDIVKALRSKAEELWHAPSIPEGKAEPVAEEKR